MFRNVHTVEESHKVFTDVRDLYATATYKFCVTIGMLFHILQHNLLNKTYIFFQQLCQPKFLNRTQVR